MLFKRHFYVKLFMKTYFIKLLLSHHNLQNNQNVGNNANMIRFSLKLWNWSYHLAQPQLIFTLPSKNQNATKVNLNCNYIKNMF